MVPNNMVKHINLLSLCLMFYVIGNLDATLTRQHQFNRAVECFRQMFDENLMVGSKEYQNNPSETFDTVLANFSNTKFHDISRADVLQGKLPTDYKNKQYDITKTSDHIMGAVISLFVFNTFIKSNDFDQRINDLKKKVNNQELIIDPLRTFIDGYGNKNAKFTCSTPNIFCNEYRSDEKFAINLPEDQMNNFDTLVSMFSSAPRTLQALMKYIELESIQVYSDNLLICGGSLKVNQLDNGLSYEDVLNGKIPNTPDMLMEEAITVFVCKYSQY
ncbi:uncharacterized protein LOC111034407 [Myzus persicae]|uniref:uncharacterized protein LOC111034407 n=1 Tax=Myzus persicae TaxID=13164 RepID=UPI000B93096C|nr:uncharacterized protein LOC111034407 [Myzus persicae]